MRFTLFLNTIFFCLPPFLATAAGEANPFIELPKAPSPGRLAPVQAAPSPFMPPLDLPPTAAKPRKMRRTLGASDLDRPGFLILRTTCIYYLDGLAIEKFSPEKIKVGEKTYILEAGHVVNCKGQERYAGCTVKELIKIIASKKFTQQKTRERRQEIRQKKLAQRRARPIAAPKLPPETLDEKIKALAIRLSKIEAGKTNRRNRP